MSDQVWLAVGSVCLAYRLVVSPVVRTSALRLSQTCGLWQLSVIGAIIMPLALLARGSVITDPSVGWMIDGIVALFTWRCVTADYDLTAGRRSQICDRLLLALFALGSVLAPQLILVWLAIACGRLRAWQHHGMLGLRLVKMYYACLLASGVFQFLNHSELERALRSSVLLMLISVAMSHYFKPAISKALLGPRPWSWAGGNRLDYMVASAYNWGWQKLISDRSLPNIAHGLRRVSPILCGSAMLLELSTVSTLWNPRIFELVSAGLLLFHVAIFVASGILFWENMCCLVMLLVVVAGPGHWSTVQTFGPTQALIGSVLIIAAVGDVVWQPFHLGWWDSPYTNRITWEVVLGDGSRYQLYANFMCPYEREFGRWLGYFLLDEPVVHGPVGGIFRKEARDAIVATRGKVELLRRVSSRHGRAFGDLAQSRAHVDYLRETFRALNASSHKGPARGRLSWLKAPGGQMFYWGSLPAFARQGTVKSIVIRSVEHFFDADSGRNLLLGERVLRDIEIETPQP